MASDSNLNFNPFEHCCRNWCLASDGDPIETNSSWLLPVIHKDGAAMLKVFKPGSDECKSGKILRFFDGIGAVRVIRAMESALMLERAHNTPSLMSMALSGGDDEAAVILASVVNQLHLPREHNVPTGLIGLRDWFKPLFAYESELPILQRCGNVARQLLTASQGECVLHGDLHHDNVLYSGRGWIAIDPKGLYGERTYEVANLLGNPAPYGEIVHDPDRTKRLANLYAGHLGLGPQRTLAFALAHAGLAASWHMEDGQDPFYRLKCAEILYPLVE